MVLDVSSGQGARCAAKSSVGEATTSACSFSGTAAKKTTTALGAGFRQNLLARLTQFGRTGRGKRTTFSLGAGIGVRDAPLVLSSTKAVDH